MQLRGGMGELMRQAARMQRKVDELTATLKTRETMHGAADGKVQVTVNGEGRLVKVDIDADFLAAEGLSLALDAVVAAANGALAEAEAVLEAETKKITGGVKVPGVPG